MEVIIIVKTGGQNVYEHKTRLGNLQIPSKGETIAYNDGEGAKITRVEWNFDKKHVYVICD